MMKYRKSNQRQKGSKNYERDSSATLYAGLKNKSLFRAAIWFTGILFTFLYTPLKAQITEQPPAVYGNFSGNIGHVQNGVTMYIDQPSGTFDINIPTCNGGSPATIVAAYLVWMDRNWSSSDPVTFDQDIIVDFNGSGNTTITVDDNFTAIDPTKNRYFHTGIADITTFVQANYSAGANTVIITGWDVPTGNPSWAQKFGIGVQVVYECAEFENRDIAIFAGNDFFYQDEAITFGDYSTEVCYTFDAATTDRDLTIKGMYGGQANAIAPFRGNQLWYLTGTGATPTEGTTFPTTSGVIVNDPDAIQIGDPNSVWVSGLGAEWDSLNYTLNVPAGDTYVCIQGYSRESAGSANGISGNMVSPVFSLANPLLCVNPEAGDDAEICQPKSTLKLKDAPAGTEWVAAAGNTATIDATTGAITGMTDIGTYTFTLRDIADNTCSDDIIITVTANTPNLLCNDGSTSITATSEPGVTNVVWFNSAGTQVGTGTSLIIDSNVAGLEDGNDWFYYTGQDSEGCDVELCCPVVVITEDCCPTPNCLNVTVIKN